MLENIVPLTSRHFLVYLTHSIVYTCRSLPRFAIGIALALGADG